MLSVLQTEGGVKEVRSTREEEEQLRQLVEQEEKSGRDRERSLRVRDERRRREELLKQARGGLATAQAA